VWKGWMFLGISSSLDELNEYLRVTEELLVRAKDDFDARVDKETKGLSEEELEELDLGDTYSEDYWRYTEEFPKILRSSLLVTAFSAFEHSLGVLCERLQSDKHIPIGLNILKGDILERLKNYFKLTGLAISYNNKRWQELSDYSMVRNCIVHNNGLVKGFADEVRLRNYANKNGIIGQSPMEDEIVLTKEFCSRVIRTMIAFMKQVHDAYWAGKSASPA